MLFLIFVYIFLCKSSKDLSPCIFADVKRVEWCGTRWGEGSTEEGGRGGRGGGEGGGGGS